MTRWMPIAALALAMSQSTAGQPIAGEHRAIPFVPLENEPPAELFVDQPLAGPLARGAVIIPVRTRHFRVLPVFGSSSLEVSPRAGHLHVSVDDLPWRWADAGDNGGVVINGLPAGPHKVLIELATPTHGVLVGKAVEFIIPAMANSVPAPHSTLRQ